MSEHTVELDSIEAIATSSALKGLARSADDEEAESFRQVAKAVRSARDAFGGFNATIETNVLVPMVVALERQGDEFADNGHFSNAEHRYDLADRLRSKIDDA